MVEQQRTRAELEAGLPAIRQSPQDEGPLQLIVRRPRVERRELLEHGELDPAVGLVGDCWRTRGSWDTADGTANPEAQLTLMNSRLAALVAGDDDRWALAGDQLYLDLDLSVNNLPPGSRLAIGTAVVEITAAPHLGCKKFTARFGRDAMKFVNSDLGKQLRLRGANAKVIQPGLIRLGDVARKVAPAVSS